MSAKAALGIALGALTGISGDVVLVPPPKSLLECGSALVARDVDGDGRNDLLVGCSSTNADAVGGVLVFRGTRNGGYRHLTTIRQRDPVRADGCGQSVAVGDVNGDGRPDVAVGCYPDALDAPEVKVFVAFNRGGGRFRSNRPAVTGRALDRQTRCKSALQGGGVALGDVNGDGRADLVVGCPANRDDWGAVHVLTRKAANNGFERDAVLRRGKVRRFAACGWRVATGDVNGDSRSDVVASCPYDQRSPSTTVGRLWRQGTVAVFRRNRSNTGFAAPIVLAHPRGKGYMECGRAVAAGRVDRDRRADVLLGCDFAGASVLFGARRRGFDSGTVLASPRLGERCGASVALGDVDGDRRVDALAGCRAPDVGSRPTGAALVFRQFPNGAFARALRLDSGARRTHDMCGYAVAAVRWSVALACPGTERGAPTGAVRVLPVPRR